ncbi:MAG: ACP S-malonyltransferase [Chloroflexi bacterium]|nr:ACP S-malonyltransferase [Chloroflexota bacterium]
MLQDALGDLPRDPAAAWLFPGQGAQHPGMGRDLYAESAAARAVFDEADDALGIGLSRLCFEGPAEELTRTVNAQPALVAHGLAALAAAIEGGGVTARPGFLAGHSLGEYAALVAAGSLSVSAGLRLVRERGRLMQEACDREPGSMAAVVALDRDRVEQLCRAHGSTICNENAPGNVTIGGAPEAVEAACEQARSEGGRVFPLAVAGAFHTPLMASAAEGMRSALGGVRFADPRQPVVSNVTARPLTRADELPEELVAQITSPVRWADSVRAMAEAGVSRLVEFGPGKTLTGAARRTVPGIGLQNVETAADARAAADAAAG